MVAGDCGEMCLVIRSRSLQQAQEFDALTFFLEFYGVYRKTGTLSGALGTGWVRVGGTSPHQA